MSWPVANPQFPPPLEADEDELNMKLEFAGYMANGASARAAAYKVFRNDFDTAGKRYFGRALQAEKAWESDPIVREEIEARRAPDAISDLHPTNDAFDYEVLQLARDKEVAAKDRLAAFELYANLRGRQTKAAAVTNVNVDNRTQTVMAIPPEMSIEEWKARSAELQAAKRIANARAA